MKSVVFYREADSDLLAAMNYYNNQMDNLGLDFIDEVDKSIDLIQKSPTRWPIVEENFRKYILQKFPFIIYYVDDLEEIIILAIVHQSRKPGFWKNR